MSTRASQIELLLGPLTDPLTGALCSGYTAYFYEAGTSTPKNVWTEKEKTNAYESYALDSGGKVKLYGDGIYKIVIKDLDAVAVLTMDDIKIQATTFSVVQKTGTYTATPDDDVILCSGTFTVNLQTVANFEHPIIIKNIGSGSITVDPYSTQTIDASSTVTIVPGDTLRLYPDATSSVWRRDQTLTDIDGQELILDADGDTSISADTDDQIDFKIGGTDQFSFKDGIIEPTTDNDIDIGSASKQFKNIYLEGSLVQNGVTRIITAQQDFTNPYWTTVQFTGLGELKFYKLSFYVIPAYAGQIYIQFNSRTSSGYYANYHESVWNGSSMSAVLSQVNNSTSIALMSSLSAAGNASGTFFIIANSILIRLHGEAGSMVSASERSLLTISGYHYLSTGTLSTIEIKHTSGNGFPGKFILEELG